VSGQTNTVHSLLLKFVAHEIRLHMYIVCTYCISVLLHRHKACTCAYIYTPIYTHIYILINAFVHSYLHSAWTHTHTYKYSYTLNTYICMHSYTHSQIDTHVYTYIHTYIHMYTYTYAYTHLCGDLLLPESCPPPLPTSMSCSICPMAMS
jgi:hypothetical protein